MVKIYRNPKANSQKKSKPNKVRPKCKQWLKEGRKEKSEEKKKTGGGTEGGREGGGGMRSNGLGG